jgi:vitamin B12 transporter
MLDMPRAFRDDLATEASLSHTWQTLDFGEGAQASHQDEHLYTAINRWSWYPLSQLTFRAGGDYRYITLDSTSMEHHDRHDGGIYLTGEYKPHERFLIIPSVKAAFSNYLVVPVPKLGLVWEATDALTLRNNYFRSFKFPDFQDLYWTDANSRGDPDLRSEDGWGGDLGAAYRWENGVALESTFFTQYTDDSIHWYPVNGVYKPTNVGGAIFFGLDSKIRGAVPLSRGPFEKIGLSLSYQYLLSYLLSYGYTWDSDKRIPYMPAHTLGASVDIPWKTGSLLISGHFESARYAEIANVTRMDPYFLLNITANQKINAHLTAFGIVRNALNSSYESFKTYPMPGITVTLGVRIHYEYIPGLHLPL